MKNHKMQLFRQGDVLIERIPALPSKLKKLNRELYKQDRKAYEQTFEEIARKRGKSVNARRAAIALSSLMDGLWLQWDLDPTGFTPEEAEAACLDMVNGAFT